jgi:hypothetical protein
MSNEMVKLINREIGENVLITGNRDYKEPRVRVVPNTYRDAQDYEKAIYISQGEGGVSLSVETLEAIINWAKERNNG